MGEGYEDIVLSVEIGRMMVLPALDRRRYILGSLVTGKKKWK